MGLFYRIQWKSKEEKIAHLKWDCPEEAESSLEMRMKKSLAER